MNRQAKEWQIWVDTGGTFTDCMARSPEGRLLRAKVLSSSCLRGRILADLGEGRYRVEQRWDADKDIFHGYRFSLLGVPSPPARVVRFDVRENILELDQASSVTEGLEFDIYAGEEAPILAVRLITQTSLNEALPPLQLRLGSTKGTNALLERKGAEVTLLITRGLTDLMVIGNQQRPNLFQLNIPQPAVLYREVVAVDERLDASGKVLVPLPGAQCREIAAGIRTESVAVAFLHAYRNPVHEKQMQQALTEAGIRFISLSHQLSPAIKLLPRAQTALVNAYLSPVIDQYLQGIRQMIGSDPERKLLVMTSAGGLIPSAEFRPKDSLLSGPAGGVVGAARVAQQLGFTRILTLDMGGTSTDTARYHGRHDYRFITKIADIEMLSPTLDIETVAAGGGSICSFDGVKLSVGPESAGASPGPACYGAGGPLTITDVNLLLGKLDPAAMGIPVSREKAAAALLGIQKEIREKTGTEYSREELLRGFEAIANEKMADAIRRISVSRGFDPEDYALLAFGGAGGLHACRIAELLDIDTIILPFDAGLLSAYGMGMATVERIVEQQVLQPLSECKTTLDTLVKELAKTAGEQLLGDGFNIDQIRIAEVRIFIRFAGQDSSLELSYRNPDSVESDFRQAYERLFGHYPEGRTLEVESIKLIAATLAEEIPKDSLTGETDRPAPLRKEEGGNAFAVYDWQQLPAGSRLDGPAVVLNPTSTAFLEKGWEMVVSSEKNAVLTRTRETATRRTAAKEAVELELFTNRFTAIAEEMGAQLQRTAFSVNIKERLDFSCAVLDPDARLLVNAPHIPVHLGSLGICARLVRDRIALRKGDVAIVNHPRYGGSHLPDVTLVAPVYTPDDRLIAYVVNRAHHAEIGGKRPGSMPPDARNLAEEGVVFLPAYLVKDGEVQWEKIESMLATAPYPSRAVAENLADINAALASLRAGEKALQELVITHGWEKVRHYMQALKNYARDALGAVLAPMEGRSFRAEEALDDGHRIAVSIQVKNKRISLDFSGASGVHPANLNANISIVYSAVIYFLRLLCGKSIPLNEGLMELVDIHLPTSFLHPEFPDDPELCPAVVGGNTEVSQRLVDTLLKAMQMAACSQGTMNNFLFGDDRFGYYETIGGGAGAGDGFHGRAAVHQHMTNTRITDPEELELRYPVRLHRFAVRQNSGGKGRWRGGDGIIREMEFLQAVEATILSQHRKVPPYGMKGGHAGRVGEQYLVKADGRKVPLEGVDSRSLEIGDRIVIFTPGGGGWGVGE